MFLINLNGTNARILKNIYMNIDCFNLYNKVFLVYEFDFTDGYCINKNIQAHIFVLDLNQLENCDESAFQDIILDLIEVGSNVMIKPYTGSNEVYKRLADTTIDDYGLKYAQYYFDIEKIIDLAILEYNELQIIYEIFEEAVPNKYYTPVDFMFRYNITKEGTVYFEDKPFAELSEIQFSELLLMSISRHKEILNEYLTRSGRKNVLSNKMYEPYIFIEECTNIEEKIMRYKLKIFEAVKNIEPELYPKIPVEITQILNKNGYIQMKDIEKIIVGDKNAHSTAST